MAQGDVERSLHRLDLLGMMEVRRPAADDQDPLVRLRALATEYAFLDIMVK
jgi:hypothetical protein